MPEALILAIFIGNRTWPPIRLTGLVALLVIATKVTLPPLPWLPGACALITEPDAKVLLVDKSILPPELPVLEPSTAVIV